MSSAHLLSRNDRCSIRELSIAIIFFQVVLSIFVQAPNAAMSAFWSLRHHWRERVAETVSRELSALCSEAESQTQAVFQCHSIASNVHGIGGVAWQGVRCVDG